MLLKKKLIFNKSIQQYLKILNFSNIVKKINLIKLDDRI